MGDEEKTKQRGAQRRQCEREREKRLRESRWWEGVRRGIIVRRKSEKDERDRGTKRGRRECWRAATQRLRSYGAPPLLSPVARSRTTTGLLLTTTATRSTTTKPAEPNTTILVRLHRHVSPRWREPFPSVEQPSDPVAGRVANVVLEQRRGVPCPISLDDRASGGSKVRAGQSEKR